MNGLDLLLHLLNSTDTNSEVRSLTNLVLGAAFQGWNQSVPFLQSKFIDLFIIF